MYMYTQLHTHQLFIVYVCGCIYKSFVTHKSCSCGPTVDPGLPQFLNTTEILRGCSVLQCVAVRCSMLQHVAVRYSGLPQNTQRRASAAHHCIIARCCHVP